MGSTYKIVAKVFANRIKKVLPKVIDKRQSVFLENRNLLHSVVMANKVVDEARRKNKSWLIFKLYYENA